MKYLCKFEGGCFITDFMGIVRERQNNENAKQENANS